MEDLIRKVKHHIRKDGLKSKCRNRPEMRSYCLT